MRRRWHAQIIERPMFLKAAGSATLLLVVLVLAGCGGDDGASSADEYADGVCSSLNTWATSVEDTVKGVADQGLSIDERDVRTALDDIKDANQSLTNDLEGLGPPETDDGNKAKSELDSLTATIAEQADKVEEALNSGARVTAIAGTVTTAIAAAANAVDMTLQNLKQLDPAGELQDAFENSDECKSLEDQLERNSS